MSPMHRPRASCIANARRIPGALAPVNRSRPMAEAWRQPGSARGHVTVQTTPTYLVRDEQEPQNNERGTPPGEVKSPQQG